MACVSGDAEPEKLITDDPARGEEARWATVGGGAALQVGLFDLTCAGPLVRLTGYSLDWRQHRKDANPHVAIMEKRRATDRVFGHQITGARS
jgi:hypothetical protein